MAYFTICSPFCQAKSPSGRAEISETQVVEQAFMPALDKLKQLIFLAPAARAQQSGAR